MKTLNSHTIPMITYRYSSSIEIIPLGDLHIGSQETNLTAISRAIEHVKEKPNRFVVLTGDLIDNALKTSKSNAYEATMPPNLQVRYVAELLEPISSRILCMVDGNHEARTKRDVDVSLTHWVALELGLADVWRPSVAFLYVDLGNAGGGRRGKRRPKYSIAVTHGVGGGLSAGAGLNRNKPYARAMNCDLIITGHTHQPAVGNLLRYDPDLSAGVMVPKRQTIMIGTGWMNYGGYGMEKMYDPLPIAPNKAILSDSQHHITTTQF